MDSEKYLALLGSLVGNLHSLEFLLRAYLSKLPSAQPLGIPPGVDFYSLPVGTELPENAFTNYDSLDRLIEKVNCDLAVRNGPQIDRSIIEIRDALAHGRVSSLDPSNDLHLIKFDRPNRSGTVRIVFNEVLTSGWLEAQRNRVYEAIQIIYGHMPP